MKENGHNRYLLKDTGAATPQFSCEKAPPLSRSTQPEKIVLGSGFSINGETPEFPLSAALQLNGDCTTMEPAELAAFGQAELEKQHRVSYRSYDVEPNYRVCVIADAAELLAKFSDTYGGILEIEPLLIGAYHEDFGHAEELEIVPSGRGYKLSYTVKSPVNFKRCTHCGLCGRICPERCISENLFFDFGSCTFCTDCEKNCPENAIDLHGIERINLEIPAIITLGDTQLSLPERKTTIFSEDRVSDFLATIYGCSVDEVITCDHAICHLNGNSSSGLGCRECLHSCSFGAVTIANSKIAIDPFSCTECGACVSACPTGAIQNQKLTDQSFLEFFRSFELKKNTAVVIGSAADLGRFWWYSDRHRFDSTLFLEMPQSESLSLMHMLFLFAHGARSVCILSQQGSTGANLLRTVDEVNLMLERWFDLTGFCSISQPDDLSVDLPKGKSTNTSLEQYRDLSFVNRRQKLSSVAEFLAGCAEKDITVEKGEVRYFGTIQCNEKRCTQCLACLNCCPIGALSADPENLTLGWNGGLCVGCRSCVGACPENALSYAPLALLNNEYFKSRVIAQAEPMRCEGCGKIFGTKKSFDRVIEILSRNQQNPPEHLHYCEDCRVLKLFENQ
jgi:ferredoxin